MFKLEFATDNAAFDDGNRINEAARILREIADKMESARLVAGIASGPLKRKARRATAAHHANVMALSSAIDGPMPDDIAAMTDDELLAELRQ